LLGRVRDGVDRDLPHAAVRGQGDAARVVLRLLPRSGVDRDARRRSAVPRAGVGDDPRQLDADHALVYEKKLCRRGVLFALEQARSFVAGTAANRMYRYDWEPVTLRPQRVIDGIRALGVDVTNWGG